MQQSDLRSLLRPRTLVALSTAALGLTLLVMSARSTLELLGPSPAADSQSVLAALNEVRTRGCSTEPGGAAALNPDPRLTTATALAADGLAIDEALREAQYRPASATIVKIQGHKGTKGLVRTIAKDSCATLMQAALRDFGFHARGNDAWIAFAAPFETPADNQIDEAQARVLNLVNAARAQARQCGSQSLEATGPVRLNAQLYAAAKSHADDMASQSYFSHTGRDGREVAQRVTQAGYIWRTVGENIASGQMQADVAVQGWIDSPSHCVNLMQASYTDMGLAFAVNPRSEGGIYWVQVFGRPR